MTPPNRVTAALLLLIAVEPCLAQATLTRATNFGVAVASDRRLAVDVLGDIWVLPAGGGMAVAVTETELPARRPRWSPDNTAIVYSQRTEDAQHLALYRLTDGAQTRLGEARHFDQQPSWHPDGERIVFSSQRGNSGFDLWELDLESRLAWRLTDSAGDETEPAWSATGRDLVYIYRDADTWSLMLRRHGQPDAVLESSATRLSSPAWRPDGSLVTFLRHDDSGYSVDMAILAEPVLVRPLVRGEDFFVAPVAWQTRQQLLYTANGVIRRRNFNGWTSTSVPFRIAPRAASPRAAPQPVSRQLPLVDTPDGRLVLRTARLFDGIGGGYRQNLDIVITGGTITAVEARRDRPGETVVDLGDLTALPGFIDAHAALPAEVDVALGPVLLSYGVTTLVSAHADAARLNRSWSGTATPGPRVLGESWQLQLDSLSATIAGAAAGAASPAGIRYENSELHHAAAPELVLSGLADARTRGLRQLLRGRQAGLLEMRGDALRGYVDKPVLPRQSPALVLGSAPNGLPPGMALHAEFLALGEAGLGEEMILRASGINAATALGLGLQAGRIAPGASADIVIVDGDPLARVADAQNVVGVVRNGRFYSAIGLIERASATAPVEKLDKSGKFSEPD
jgi:hypothetical protein